MQIFLKYFESLEDGIQFPQLLVSKDYFALYYKAQLFSFFFYFLTELENILGPRFLFDYVRGKYRKPTVEHRVLLFMDLRNSTSIAEKMGDTQYFYFINKAYSLLDRPLMLTNGEILKYVGDEVIVSWKYEDGIAFDNCLRFFMLYKQNLENNGPMFLKKYGEIPEFKAGMHDGKIVAAYIGDVKKQLDFSGDTMNTTARIMDTAKQSDCDILLSDKLFYALDYAKYEVEKFPQTNLKGKEEHINLVGLKIQTKLH
jgi:adenylate cyclase